MGFEDYIKIPWESEELHYRINKIYKNHFDFGKYNYLEKTNFSIFVNSLNIQELSIFKLLFSNLNEIVNRETLLLSIWECFSKKTRIVDMHISNIRKKLKIISNFEILSIRKQGSKLIRKNNNEDCG